MKNNDEIKFGKIGRVIELTEDKIINENKEVKSLIVKAREHRSKGEYGQELENYELALSFLPNHVGILNMIGNTLIELNRFTDAIKYLQTALNLEKENLHTLTNIGAAYSKLGDYDRAISYCDIALSVNPSFSIGYFNKACSLAMKSEITEALEALGTAIRLDKIWKKNALTEEDFINIRDLESFRLLVD